MKTRKSVTKRFKITKNGKVIHRHNFNRHLKTGKSKAKRRQKNKPVTMTNYYAKKIRKALGVTLKKGKPASGESR